MINGRWNILIKAMGMEKEGIIDFDEQKVEILGMEIPLRNLAEKKEGVYTFDATEPDKGQTITFKIRVVGDDISGKAKLGPIPVSFTGKRA